MQIRVTRTIDVPDPFKLARYKKSPDYGPRVLFFSGGSALRDICAVLTEYTHNSIHIITPFDSGGSSAIIREAFHMPAIGDVRNRLLALADHSLFGNPAIFRLFAHRFPANAEQNGLISELKRMIRGHSELVADIPDPMRKIIRHHLQLFLSHMPVHFDLRRASIGNLVLTGGYLENERNMDSVIFIFSKMVRVLGMVRPVINKDLHLVAETADGRRIVGQHLLTGKQAAPIASRVEKLYLCADRSDPVRVQAVIREKMIKLIGQAHLICYPPGSFYSSVLCNFLPGGVGRAVAANPCPKVYVPNTCKDPEQFGLPLDGQVARILEYLQKDAPEAKPADLLNYVILDENTDRYPDADMDRIREMGVETLFLPLVAEKTGPGITGQALVPVLLSLA